jgi:hypothetical protein
VFLCAAAKKEESAHVPTTATLAEAADSGGGGYHPASARLLPNVYYFTPVVFTRNVLQARWGPGSLL